ncbi:hypothetical protein ANTPLA_LOCUS589 [Anthophora plagiata]
MPADKDSAESRLPCWQTKKKCFGKYLNSHLFQERTPERISSVGFRRKEKNAERKRSARLLNGVRDKKQIRFTHSRFPLANSISSGVPLTLCL